MKVFVTKYALTEGILEHEADLSKNEPSMCVVVGRPGQLGQYFHGEGKEWHRTRDLALVRAEEMRQAKVKSLKKSLAKFEKMKFV